MIKFNPELSPSKGTINLKIASGYYNVYEGFVYLSIYLVVESVVSPSGDLNITNFPDFGPRVPLSYPGVAVYADTLSALATTAIQGMVQRDDRTGWNIHLTRFANGAAYPAASCVKAGTILRISATFPVEV